MDVIGITRQLGAAIQQDERYFEFAQAKKANDEDAALNELIGRLNLVQMAYQNEADKEAADEQRLEQLDADFRNIYGEIMLNESMKKFEEKKQAVDDMMNYIINILTLCVNGGDPATCEPQAENGDCSGNCASCGGCG